ncbi:bag family molecular chaperone regulator 1-like protein [Trifolium pratense]|uniref:Bag family molecular chaperone regulator 1-like protein n=1 Tax=Trifolium pratense TaxID=57577 RepID=A0A2K3NG62_TRIPR|nr:bag family molecular chaperone regulator 1-like protein [Trifolium pratense]PNX99830.1 bag family molecular chaperone regulator 1-like protein [Trifolium pratense]PNY02020.1 bag family molecular chaperone regulator 1-like protein [Trifolium pratense]
MFSRSKNSDNNVNGNVNSNVAELELRPGGMIVQKRNSDVSKNSSSIIKIKVKYGSSYHQIHISSHASFGELKKMLTESTGLHVEDQKLIFKKKERDSKSYLDVERVKDGSKLVLIEDIEREGDCSNLEFGRKVSDLEGVVSKGGVIAELDVESLTENLMRVLITLDEIYGDSELKLKRKEQVKRVQKQIETLDMLKMSKPKEDNIARESKVHCGVQKQHLQEKQELLKQSDSVVVTTKWETFD